MPSPGELVRTVADALGLPEATVVVHDRNLVTEGLRRKGGRGLSAAKVTARDAAHLLTAVLGSGQVKDSASSVRRYSETRPLESASSDAGFAKIGIAELANLPAEHSFVDAMEALIASAASGSLTQAMLDVPAGSRPMKSDATPLIQVAALTPGTVGDIRVAGTRGGMSASVRYALPSPWAHSKHPPDDEVEGWEAKIAEHGVDTDLEQYRRISAKTIMRIGELLRLGGSRK
jgi:hypothetical protein